MFFPPFFNERHRIYFLEFFLVTNSYCLENRDCLFCRCLLVLLIDMQDLTNPVELEMGLVICSSRANCLIKLRQQSNKTDANLHLKLPGILSNDQAEANKCLHSIYVACTMKYFITVNLSHYPLISHT